MAWFDQLVAQRVTVVQVIQERLHLSGHQDFPLHALLLPPMDVTLRIS